MGYIDDNEFDWTGKTMVTFIFVYFFCLGVHLSVLFYEMWWCSTTKEFLFGARCRSFSKFSCPLICCLRCLFMSEYTNENLTCITIQLGNRQPANLLQLRALRNAPPSDATRTGKVCNDMLLVSCILVFPCSSF